MYHPPVGIGHDTATALAVRTSGTDQQSGDADTQQGRNSHRSSTNIKTRINCLLYNILVDLKNKTKYTLELDIYDIYIYIY